MCDGWSWLASSRRPAGTRRFEAPRDSPDPSLSRLVRYDGCGGGGQVGKSRGTIVSTLREFKPVT